jgi:thiamine pyrophosphokinase
MLDESGEVFVVWDRRTIAGDAGDYVSLMPLTPFAEAVSTTGLKYALYGDTLRQGRTRGISNELVGAEGSIDVGSGCLLVRHQWNR